MARLRNWWPRWPASTHVSWGRRASQGQTSQIVLVPMLDGETLVRFSLPTPTAMMHVCRQMSTRDIMLHHDMAERYEWLSRRAGIQSKPSMQKHSHRTPGLIFSKHDLGWPICGGNRLGRVRTSSNSSEVPAVPLLVKFRSNIFQARLEKVKVCSGRYVWSIKCLSILFSGCVVVLPNLEAFPDICEPRGICMYLWPRTDSEHSFVH